MPTKHLLLPKRVRFWKERIKVIFDCILIYTFHSISNKKISKTHLSSLETLAKHRKVNTNETVMLLVGNFN